MAFMASLLDIRRALVAVLLILCFGQTIHGWGIQPIDFDLESLNDGIRDDESETKLGKFCDENKFGAGENEMGETALHSAAFFGKLKMVSSLIQKGASIRARDDYGKTPLHAAVLGGRRTIAKFLLNSGADINAQDGNGSTPLHVAVSIKLPGMVRDLLDSAEIDVNLFNKDLMTPLHMAVATGEEYIASLLVEKAQLDLPSGEEGLTAFHLAVINQDLAAISMLATSGANINARTFNGSTSLHLSITRDDERTTEYLLAMEGIMLNLKNDECQSPLRLAEQLQNQAIINSLLGKQTDVNSRLITSVTEGNLPDVARLIVSGANLAYSMDTNGTALHIAASNGHLNVVKLLLEAGLYVDIRSLGGITALHAAARAGHLPVVEYLTREGADINARDNSGATVLHKAPENTDLVKYCLKLKSNINARDDRGWTPLHGTILARNEDAFNELTKFGDEYDPEMSLDLDPYTIDLVTPLHLAVTTNQISIVESLVEKGAQLERPGKEGFTAFHYAALNSNLEIMTLLDQQGADINAKISNRSTALHLVVSQRNIISVTHLLNMKQIKTSEADENGQTPLQLAEQLGYDEIAKRILEKITSRDSGMINAADNGELAVVKVLVEDGANVASTDLLGETALHKAARNGHWEVVRYLLQKGADMHAEQHSGYTALTQAADSGQTEIVKLMLDQGADVNFKDMIGMGLLHWAAHGGNVKLAEFLVNQGAEIDAVDDDGETPLHKAAWMGWLDMVKYLCGLKANVNAQRNNGDTPLHWAACNGYTSIVKYLVMERLAKLSVANQRGETALDCAERNAQTDTADFLKKYSELLDDFNGSEGTDSKLYDAAFDRSLSVSEGEGLGQVTCHLNGTDSLTGDDGDTALHQAAKKGNLRFVKYLISQGANITAINDQGDTPLVSAAVRGQVNVVKELLACDNEVHTSYWQKEQFPSAETISQLGKRELFRVADGGCPGSADVALIILSCGVDVSSVDDNGMNVLHWAAHGGNTELISKLLDSGYWTAESYRGLIDGEDYSGRSPLLIAAQMGNADAVLALLNHLPDVEYPDFDGETALHKAAEGGNLDVVKYLVSGGANINSVDHESETPLHKAACLGNVKIVDYLISKGADISARMKDGHQMTPLIKAANCGQLEVVKTFLSNPGGIADVRDTDDTGMTLLHWAAHGGNPYLVQYLLDIGAPIDAKDFSGETPLHKAAWMGQRDAAICLVGNGADLNARTNDGNTPLHWAAYNNRMEMASFLVDSGADKSITNDERDTPESMAREVGNTLLADYLRYENIAAIDGSDENDFITEVDEEDEDDRGSPSREMD